MTPSATNLTNRSAFSVTLLMAVTLFTFVMQKPVLLISGTFACAAYALVCFRKSRFCRDQLVLFLVACMLFTPGLINGSHGFSPFFYFFSTLMTFFAAEAVCRNSPDVLLISLRLIYAASVTAIACALYLYWSTPDPLGEVIPGSSANGIPSYLIVIQVALSLCNYVVSRRLPILSPVITCAVAFFGYGRGSLIVSGLIAVLSLILNIRLTGSTNRLYKLLSIFLLLVVGTGIAWQFEQITDLLTLYTKFGLGFVDYNRIEIWQQYLEKIDPWSLLVGADYAGTVIDMQYDGNPHISFIRTHAYFGLPITLLALASPLFILSSRKIVFAKIVFFSFIVVSLIRASSEPIFFPTLLDFYYFLYFFLYFRYAPTRESRHAVLPKRRMEASL
jgi:hypothetical protein